MGAHSAHMPGLMGASVSEMAHAPILNRPPHARARMCGFRLNTARNRTLGDLPQKPAAHFYSLTMSSADEALLPPNSS